MNTTVDENELKPLSDCTKTLDSDTAEGVTSLLSNHLGLLLGPGGALFSNTMLLNFQIQVIPAPKLVS